MKYFIFAIYLIFLFITNIYASNKENIITKLESTNNLTFNFIQTVDGKDEKGNCIIEYPKKIFCKYEERKKKILVSNGKTLVIKNNKQYYRYPIKSTPFEYLLDKKFLID